MHVMDWQDVLASVTVEGKTQYEYHCGVLNGCISEEHWTCWIDDPIWRTSFFRSVRS